jgi:hypothetical protein
MDRWTDSVGSVGSVGDKRNRELDRLDSMLRRAGCNKRSRGSSLAAPLEVRPSYRRCQEDEYIVTRREYYPRATTDCMGADY